ncbi:hypothetical protein Tco_0521611, partial [Tanacetum coccineum]
EHTLKTMVDRGIFDSGCSWHMTGNKGTKVPLTKDGEAIDVDVHLYRSMIGSLMYLTASRPDIMYGKT